MEVKRGEIYEFDLNPIKGSELKDKHPAVIVSADSFNKKAPVIIICPITDAFGKDTPIHILIPENEGGLRKESVVHCGQVRAIDKERLGKKIGEFDRYKMALIGKGLKNALDLNW